MFSVIHSCKTTEHKRQVIESACRLLYDNDSACIAMQRMQVLYFGREDKIYDGTLPLAACDAQTMSVAVAISESSAL